MRKMQEANFIQLLKQGELRVPPLDIRIVAMEPASGGDAILDVVWQDQSCRLVAEVKRDAKPQTLALATGQAKQYAQSSKGCPLIIAPYLSNDKLEQLLSDGVNAMDFCGNAAIQVPGRFLFYKAGSPNQFPDSAPIRSAYRGDGSFVAYVLLLDREFKTISDIQSAIQVRGGSLTLGMVSKVLKRLESDLVIERPNRNNVRLIQPGKVLDQLLDAYQTPKTGDVWTGKISLPDTQLLDRLEILSENNELIRTGQSSAIEYATWAGEPIIECYCRTSPTQVIQRLDVEAKETRAFANLRLIQTQDQRVYFDRRPRLAASPIQSWLEMAQGDKRQKETAAQIRGVLTGDRP